MISVKQAIFSRHGTWVLVLTLLGVHFLLGAGSIAHKCNTFDEIVHLAAGFVYWTQQDYRLDPENGNLPKRLAALPLLALDLVPPDVDSENMYQAFLYAPENPTGQMLYRSRIMILLMSCILGAAVFFWSRRIFNIKAGLFSLVLYCLSPTMLAHGRLVTSDLAGALFFLLSLWALNRLFFKPGMHSTVLAGLALGGLMVSKMSFLILFPVAIVLFAMQGARVFRTGEDKNYGLKIFACLPFVLALAWLVVWAFYGFRFYAAPYGGLSLGAGIPHSGLWAFMLKCRIAPESFIMGLWDVFHKLTFRDGFLNGDYSINGWWYFFPFCFAVKTPEPVLIIVCLTVPVLLYHRHDAVLFKMHPLWVFVILYMAFAMASGINIGHRHLLPVYPALFVLAGAVPYFWGRILWIKYLMVACVLMLAVQSLWIWPHYLSYFNMVSGGPTQGFERLADSSLDWGQDLPALKKWQDGREDKSLPVYLSYFGTALPGHFGIQAIKIAPNNLFEPGIPALEPGWYCISATHLRQLYTGVLGPWSQPLENKYQALAHIVNDLRLGQIASPSPSQAAVIAKFKRARFARLCHVLSRRRPDAMAGYSICIYKVDEKELGKALFEPMSGLPKTRMVKGAGDYTLY